MISHYLKVILAGRVPGANHEYGINEDQVRAVQKCQGRTGRRFNRPGTGSSGHDS